jgi:hypothetical protein
MGVRKLNVLSKVYRILRLEIVKSLFCKKKNCIGLLLMIC